MATVLQTLARDLSNLLAEHLTPAPRVRDRVTLAILLLFAGQSPRSQYYRWNLLFRDFTAPEPDQEVPLPDGKTATLPAEAIRYVDEVLWLRRLTLANNLKERPGNIHLLLERLCQLHAAPAPFGAAAITRRPPGAAAAPERLGKTGRILQQQVSRLGDRYGDISVRRRAEFGPLWLAVADAFVEVPEEMSLDNVVEAAPLPLQARFHQDKEFAKRLLRVIEALNERYMQLRACGLKPDVWLAQERPSINQLAELRTLRLAVQRLEQDGKSAAGAFEQAFAEGLAAAGGKKFGGFTAFTEFYDDAVGIEMMRRGSVGTAAAERGRPLAAEGEAEGDEEVEFSFGGEFAGDDNGDEGEGEDAGFYPEEMDEELDLQKTFSSLPDLFPQEFSPVMRHYFQQVLAQSAAPEKKAAALRDPEFLAAVKRDSRYCELAGDALQDALFRDAEALIQRNATKWRAGW